MERKPNNVIALKSSLKGGFFRMWLEFLRPFHKLTERETDIMAAFLKQRYELSKVVSDQYILNKLTMSDDTKKKIREECNISQAHFQVIMTKLKKSKMIENGNINPRFIPRIKDETKGFQLLLTFEL